MTSKREVTLEVIGSDGLVVGHLTVRLLPATSELASPAPLLDLRECPERDPAQEPVQLLEGAEYVYEIRLLDASDSPITTDRPEILQADTTHGERGRLRPSLFTGTLPVTVLIGQTQLGKVSLEVRSRKFDYMSHYRWMLRDIAEEFAEVVMERFAPTEQRFEIDETRDAQTLYQRFSFLKSLIAGDTFESALHQILARPHRAWITEEELRPVGRSIPGGSQIARQLSTPGPRVRWSGQGSEHDLNSLPATFRVQRNEETLDTPENRFVKFVLTRWRDIVSDIGQVLSALPSGAPIKRGLREVEAVVAFLDAALSHELFDEVGVLTQFPANSQVLQKRAGYRDLFQAYVQFEAAANLAWQGGERVYGAGQRNVATLYEYWVFLKVAGTISSLCQLPFDRGSMLEASEQGLGIGLRQGIERVLTGTVDRLGRRLRVEFVYNRTFSRGRAEGSSWTRPMRPDCSLHIAPEDGSKAPFDEVWLHFDAKYRVENVTELLSQEVVGDDEDVDVLEGVKPVPAATAKRDDLLKMHAYRDAIRRTAGAYVVYPGSNRADYHTYHEVLPGLGAFAVRPTEIGDAEGINLLQSFINDVLDHVASQGTQHERSRFWTREAYDDRYVVRTAIAAVSFLDRPPADTTVLLGYVKDPDHLDWIHQQRLYNLRADGRTGSVGLQSRELATDLVVLYCANPAVVELWKITAAPRVRTRTEMVAAGYPRPRGELYYCLGLEEIPHSEWPELLSLDRVLAVRESVGNGQPHGAPVVASWLDLVRTW